MDRPIVNIEIIYREPNLSTQLNLSKNLAFAVKLMKTLPGLRFTPENGGFINSGFGRERGLQVVLNRRPRDFDGEGAWVIKSRENFYLNTLVNSDADVERIAKSLIDAINDTWSNYVPSDVVATGGLIVSGGYSMVLFFL